MLFEKSMTMLILVKLQASSFAEVLPLTEPKSHGKLRSAWFLSNFTFSSLIFLFSSSLCRCSHSPFCCCSRSQVRAALNGGIDWQRKPAQLRSSGATPPFLYFLASFQFPSCLLLFDCQLIVPLPSRAQPRLSPSLAASFDH
jgi:hypothetical protein